MIRAEPVQEPERQRGGGYEHVTILAFRSSRVAIDECAVAHEEPHGDRSEQHAVSGNTSGAPA